MSVILFKEGMSQKFDEYTFVDSLNAGWSLTEGEVAEAPAVVDIIHTEEEAVAEEVEAGPDFEEMTKVEIEVYARGYGVELDRRMNKANMIKAFNEQKG